MRLGPGMMGYVPNGQGAPAASIDQARTRAQAFADQLGLEVGEVMQFADNYYVELAEPDGALATEILVDPATGASWFEYGPAMMWNTKYGMMSGFLPHGASGMMGGGGMMSGGMMGQGFLDLTLSPTPGQDVRPTVSAEKARQAADRWLQDKGGGLTAGEAEAFPGYYTAHVLDDGDVVGMLSVNAFTGAVWYHWWHGRCVAMEEA